MRRNEFPHWADCVEKLQILKTTIFSQNRLPAKVRLDCSSEVKRWLRSAMSWIWPTPSPKLTNQVARREYSPISSKIGVFQHNQPKADKRRRVCADSGHSLQLRSNLWRFMQPDLRPLVASTKYRSQHPSKN